MKRRLCLPVAKILHPTFAQLSLSLKHPYPPPIPTPILEKPYQISSLVPRLVVQITAAPVFGGTPHQRLTRRSVPMLPDECLDAHTRA